jgi:hypothetical protein
VQDGGSGQTRLAAGLELLLVGTACSDGQRFDGVGVLRRGAACCCPRRRVRRGRSDATAAGGAPMEDLRGRKSSIPHRGLLSCM